jgi:hypothetical protein
VLAFAQHDEALADVERWPQSWPATARKCCSPARASRERSSCPRWTRIQRSSRCC